MTTRHIEVRIRRAGLLIALGLVLQVFSLFFGHALSFMAFLLVACPLVGVGIVLFLYTLVTPVVTEKTEPVERRGN